MSKKYWKGLEELTNDPEFVKHANKEFYDFDKSIEEESSPNRRDFLKLMGFSLAAVSLASCEAPVKKAIPFLNKPEEIDPSVANYYASTYVDGGDYCSILVKTREGRPIKIEGNTLSSVTQGGTSARVQASVLSLYDKQRLKGPTINGKPTSWEELDKQITARLEGYKNEGASIYIVSNTLMSPSTQSVIADFVKKYSRVEHIAYDPYSYYAITKANKESFGHAVIPSYDFSKAHVIVSFSADFLGTWLSPIEFSKQYAKTRKVGSSKKTMSRHFQFESTLTLTGANADYRVAIKPSQEGLVISKLYNLIASKAGKALLATPDIKVNHLDLAATNLWENKGASLVVSNSQDPHVQQIVNAINYLLQNYTSTIDIATPTYQKQGNDEAMARFVDHAEEAGVIIFYNANPVYDHPLGEKLASVLKNKGVGPLTISFSDRVDETTALCQFVAPDHHYLESWNDIEVKKGYFSLMQPTISPLFQTRQAQETLLKWSGSSTSYYDYIRTYWKTNLFKQQNRFSTFDMFWDKSLHDGIFEFKKNNRTDSPSLSGDVTSLSQIIASSYHVSNTKPELVLYEKIGIGSGKQSNNPWLQELPDPITKVCWDNYLAVSKKLAVKFDLKQGDIVELALSHTHKLNLPILIQPGQEEYTLAVAIGYGRTHAGKVGNVVGANVYPFANTSTGTTHFSVFNTDIIVKKTGEKRELAQTQTHHTFMGRETIIQETILKEYQKDPQAGRFKPIVSTSEGEKSPQELTLWNTHTYPNHHWVMSIDLNSCTGCGACTIACQAENNVPVVGRDEVLRRREMHWIRIDRYYSSDAQPEDLKGLEEASENPQVVFQPMMCQHCNNAPCETVCPVAATTHSTEGLNQMAYNRCIGTRYCANNCPYKVRRFNWFKYHDNKQFADVNVTMNDDLGKMVLNPDVTVRSRGVMEKCSMCVQRIQEGKLNAKKEKRTVKDGEIITACASSCPSDAIVFGDLNDSESRIAQLLQDEVSGRAYHVLEEINVNPNIYYLSKVRNSEK